MFYKSINDVHPGMYVQAVVLVLAGHMMSQRHSSSSRACLITALNVVKAVICGAEWGLPVHLEWGDKHAFPPIGLC